MDHEIRGALTMSPSAALRTERCALIAFATRLFPCDAELAARGLDLLARADGRLRASVLPRLCRRIVHRCYRDSTYRFGQYVHAVRARLTAVEAALAGEFIDGVSFDPEGIA